MRADQDSNHRRAGTARRCFRILELLAEEPYLHSLADISVALQLPKSSTHRLIGLLVDAEFVDVDASTRRYSLTAKVLWIGSSYLRNSAVERSALTVMTQLSAEAGTTSHLAVWEGDSVLIIHSTDPPNATSLFVEVGERRPVHATALGKALLAFRSETDVERICNGPMIAYTPRTITTPAALEEELARVRQAGVAVDHEEYALGLGCMAAPIRNHQGVAAALGISGDLSLLEGEQLPRLKRLVRDAALRVSAQLGSRRFSGQVLDTRDGAIPSSRSSAGHHVADSKLPPADQP